MSNWAHEYGSQVKQYIYPDDHMIKQSTIPFQSLSKNKANDGTVKLEVQDDYEVIDKWERKWLAKKRDILLEERKREDNEEEKKIEKVQSDDRIELKIRD